ncbi:hypothetical protein J8L85_12870 [Maribacter sp. MMG018]|uniref:DUF6660 family protein n=1 Tax=Maribacter sp. MMG018 TaxID=2822688 RepID=UPI001B386234|nr:DUF6660 family protein [Maribacter sp. MMG018]MBQ4915338.1 hypothetical protein [Maribacter sp. MMG018]
MKLVSVILSIYIMVLTVRPCCQDNYCGDKASCQLEQADDHQDNHKSDEHKGACSPFYTCGKCVGFTFSMPHFSLIPQTGLFVNLVSTYNRTFRSVFQMTILQPPQI